MHQRWRTDSGQGLRTVSQDVVQSEEGCWNKVADGLLRSQEIEQDFAVLAFCGTGAPWLILAQAHIPGGGP